MKEIDLEIIDTCEFKPWFINKLEADIKGCKNVGTEWKYGFLLEHLLKQGFQLFEKIDITHHVKLRKSSFRNFKKNLSEYFLELFAASAQYLRDKSPILKNLFEEILTKYFIRKRTSTHFIIGFRNIIHRKLFCIYPTDEDSVFNDLRLSLSR